MSDNPPLIREDVQGFLALVNSLPPPEALVAEEQRAGYLALKAMTEADPRPLALIRDLSCPGPAGNIPLRFYDVRESRDPSPVVLFFHGGGFVIGDLDTHHALCTELSAELDLPVLAVHYRLAPEHPFPAAPDDCEAAARWLAGSPAELDRKVTGIVTIGGSAGGNLATVTARALCDRPAAAPMLLQVLLYPATDESQDGSMVHFAEGHLLTKLAMDWFYSLYLPKSGDPRAFPLHASAQGMCPSIVATAGLDPLQDQGRRMAAKLVDAGVDTLFMHIAGMTHDFTTTRKALPSAAAATAKVIAAMKLMLQKV
ncbi:MAG: alpha/beta hydrolase [Novosphingobium sp.]|uniref:alpha/beta hydrolase n=1 Tax=Novosphingobium sp. TaxID=1874826 RepID=UPI001D22BB7A|nr:alpha/beta hydrolase [Novosphingobium sp.]MCB2057441.1 alpha/beta hydrolase [Novosphingobium sp.]MCP5386685.1 alpha/beta hydrolase [Novosphingobium sp.]